MELLNNLLQNENTYFILMVICIVFVVLTVMSFVIRAVKFGLILLAVALVLGIAPAGISAWLNANISPNNFGVVKIEPAPKGIIELPVNWIATRKDGSKMLCQPDITPDGIGSMNCTKSIEIKKLNNTCVKKDYGYVCDMKPVKLRYQKG